MKKCVMAVVLTKRRGCEGEVVVHQLAPRDHHGGGGVVVEAIVLVDVGGDDSSVGQLRAVQGHARVADAVTVIRGQQPGEGGAEEREEGHVSDFFS